MFGSGAEVLDSKPKMSAGELDAQRPLSVLLAKLAQEEGAAAAALVHQDKRPTPGAASADDSGGAAGERAYGDSGGEDAAAAESQQGGLMRLPSQTQMARGGPSGNLVPPPHSENLRPLPLAKHLQFAVDYRDCEDGTYEVTYMPRKAGRYMLTCKVADDTEERAASLAAMHRSISEDALFAEAAASLSPPSPAAAAGGGGAKGGDKASQNQHVKLSFDIKGSPFRTTVHPGVVCAENCTAVGVGWVWASTRALKNCFTIEMRDAHGNRTDRTVEAGGGAQNRLHNTFQCKVFGPSDGEVEVRPLEGQGAAVVSYKVKVTGPYIIKPTLGKTRLICDAPQDVEVTEEEPDTLKTAHDIKAASTTKLSIPQGRALERLYKIAVSPPTTATGTRGSRSGLVDSQKRRESTFSSAVKHRTGGQERESTLARQASRGVAVVGTATSPAAAGTAKRSGQAPTSTGDRRTAGSTAGGSSTVDRLSKPSTAHTTMPAAGLAKRGSSIKNHERAAGTAAGRSPSTAAAAAAPVVSYRSDGNSADLSPGGLLKTSSLVSSKSRSNSPTVPRLNINKAIQPRRDQQQRAKAGMKA